MEGCLWSGAAEDRSVQVCKAVPVVGAAGVGVQKGMQEGAGAFRRLFSGRAPSECQKPI